MSPGHRAKEELAKVRAQLAAAEAKIANLNRERNALMDAAGEVLRCRQNGRFGMDGAQGYELLEKSFAKAGGAL